MGISSANQTIEDPEAEDDPVAGPVQFRPPLDGMDGCVTLETGTTETLSLIPVKVSPQSCWDTMSLTCYNW